MPYKLKQVGTAIVVGCLLVVPTVALGDETIADGDGLAAYANNDMAFGSVGCNVATDKTAAVVIRRSGGANSTNTFNNSASVAISLSVSGTGLSASVPSAPNNTITLPSNWTSLDNGTLSAAVSSKVTVKSSTPGAGSGIVTYRATGLNTAGVTITRDDTMNVTWNTGICAPADSTPPSITPVVQGTEGANGWYTTDVAVSWTVEDAESTPTQCAPTTISTDTTGVTLTCEATSAGGTTTKSVTIKRDATAPTNVATTLARGADHNGWFNKAVGWATTGSDVTSKIAACDSGTYSGPDGTGRTVSGSCTDNAGNKASASSAAFDYDATAPTNLATTLARGADHNGWFNKAVGWATTGSDVTSKVAACDSGTYSGPDGTGRTVSGSCTDNAGNKASASSAAFDYDATAPTLSPVVTPNPVILNAIASAAHNASDAVALVASASCDPVDTSVAGSRTVACRASDNAGNTNTASASYSVQYKFNGFFQPVDNKVVNGMKAGATVAIKWQLLDANGAPQSSLSAITKVTSGVMPCDASVPVDNLEEYSTGSTELRYDSTANQFIYNWQSPKKPGSCYKVVLAFADGTSQSASFTLK